MPCPGCGDQPGRILGISQCPCRSPARSGPSPRAVRSTRSRLQLLRHLVHSFLETEPAAEGRVGPR